MAAGVELVNAALIHLGADPIVSLDDGVEDGLAARLASRLPPVRDAVLRSYLWNGAEVYAKLHTGPLPEPQFGFLHSGDLPSGRADETLPYCLRVRAVDTRLAWAVSGRKLFAAQEGALLISYTRRIEDPKDLDPLCFELIAVKLALAFSNAIGTSETRNRRRELRAIEDRLEREARRVDALEASPRQLARGTEGSWTFPRRRR